MRKLKFYPQELEHLYSWELWQNIGGLYNPVSDSILVFLDTLFADIWRNYQVQFKNLHDVLPFEDFLVVRLICLIVHELIHWIDQSIPEEKVENFGFEFAQRMLKEHLWEKGIMLVEEEQK